MNDLQFGMVLMNGITYGGLLFMCASGLTLIFGLMNVVNMSHGVFYLVGAYMGLTVLEITGSWVLAIIAGGIGTAVVAGFLKSDYQRYSSGDIRRNPQKCDCTGSDTGQCRSRIHQISSDTVDYPGHCDC